MCEIMGQWTAVAAGVAWTITMVAAQAQEVQTCYSAGSIVGAIIGTFLITIALVASFFLLHKVYWRSRKGKHLVLVTDAENPADQYAFDNPCFREATPIKKGLHPDEKTPGKLEKNRWLEWSPLQSLGSRVDKVKSLDDSCLNESQLKVVSLKSHDFTGLGFNICGNMRDGIFVKDVLHRGPAFESGCINSGDRLDSVRISFRNMVFEDALTILSYASPYEVQVHVENGVSSRPSTLIRSKRESSVVNSTERIQHPKYNRSQSISDLAELNRTQKRMNHLHTAEKNWINSSLNKSSEYSGSSNDYPTLKLSTSSEPRMETQQVQRTAPEVYHEREIVALAQPSEPNKHHKFGIKVLPISMNPKMGTQIMAGAHKAKEYQQLKNNTHHTSQNEKNAVLEKAESRKHASEDPESTNETKKEGKKEEDGVDNVKAMLTKGFQNLKDKINQNTLGRKKKESTSEEVEPEKDSQKATITITHKATPEEENKNECPVPMMRSTVKTPLPVDTCDGVPEEVTRAGDVARNNRKSAAELIAAPRRSTVGLAVEEDKVSNEVTVTSTLSASDTCSSSDRDSPKQADGMSRPKRSKGKAPAPPQRAGKEAKEQEETSQVRPVPSKQSADMNEIKKESDMDKANIFEPIQIVRDHDDAGKDKAELYDSVESDSDAENPQTSTKEVNGTRIELNATQVTVHHSPTLDTGTEEDVDTSRKAASLGDLSRLDADHTLSVVLERAVSLDLADGSAQSGKKRKAPLPPPEDFPSVFDDTCYRKEPRLEGLNTFQRRLKKSSDFGTLEDALQEGPKSLDIQLNGLGGPVDLLEAHNTHIQEFSSWLAECRKHKIDDPPRSTSLVNVNVSGQNEEDFGGPYGGNTVFSVNGVSLTEEVNFPGASSRTVLVISQPNSLEPSSMTESLSLPEAESVPKEFLLKDDYSLKPLSECETSAEQFVTASESQLDTTITVGGVTTLEEEDEDLDEDEEPPQLPSTPMPVTTPAFSSPLSSSLTYITEVKVTTTEQDSSLSSDSISDDPPPPKVVATSTPKIQDMLRANLGEVKREPKPMRADRSLSFTDGISVSHNTTDSPRRGSDTNFEYSKIPIRSMKSETGQKVLATIQSLASKDASKKTPESDYAKRVASLFSPAKLPNNQKTSSESPGFFLQDPGRKVPPVVPPRKMETTLTTVTVEVPSQDSDRGLVTFSSFLPDSRPSKIPAWNDNLSNGDHMPTSVVNLPVKTSATKIVFESKDLDGEEF